MCVDVIFGLDFQKQHEKVKFNHGGKSEVEFCGLTTMQTSPPFPPSLFSNLTGDCKPIATQSRKYCSKDDRKFISNEVKRLLAESII